MSPDPHVVPLKPRTYADFACPACGGGPLTCLGTVFPGIHILGRYRCEACQAGFLRDLPVGFAVDHPVAIDEASGALLNPGHIPSWISEPLLRNLRKPHTGAVAIERIVHRACSKVVLLNTIDFLYGHVLLKLFNAHHCMQRYPDHGLVLLLPRMYAWLVPQGVAEVWLVDVKLSAAQRWHTGIDAFVQERLKEYEEVCLARGYAHPELVEMPVERYTGIAPFPIERLPELPPHVTFVAREDRLWFRTPVHKFVSRALGRLGLKGLSRALFTGAQQRAILRTMRLLERDVEGITFSVVGLARGGGFPRRVNDLRTRTMNEAVERAWCAAYAKSAVAVGVHGSNMLLPTALAGGCVEILPHDRFGNIVQDVAVRHGDRMQLFLYRFIDEFASARTVARHVRSIFHDFSTYHRHNRVNVFGAVQRT